MWMLLTTRCGSRTDGSEKARGKQITYLAHQAGKPWKVFFDFDARWNSRRVAAQRCNRGRLDVVSRCGANCILPPTAGVTTRIRYQDPGFENMPGGDHSWSKRPV